MFIKNERVMQVIIEYLLKKGAEPAEAEEVAKEITDELVEASETKRNEGFRKAQSEGRVGRK